mmetsp:Transcript_4494/g.8216  ORF Transcript_4494/g.8216 Transcript_4494/m.8216 type:complete len:250 (+) Transcript_4494:789-1538(+)
MNYIQQLVETNISNPSKQLLRKQRDLIEAAAYNTITRLGLEPCGFRRHDHSRIGNIHELIELYGIQSNSSHTVLVASLDQSTQAANSAHEINALIATNILNAQHRSEDQICQKLTIKHFHQIGMIDFPCLDIAPIPLLVNIERAFALLSWFRIPTCFQRLDIVRLAKFAQKLLARHAVQRAKDTVVIHDFQIGRRVMNGHEKHEWLISRQRAALRFRRLPSHFAHIKRRRSSMMSIRNICGRNFLKRLG